MTLLSVLFVAKVGIYIRKEGEVARLSLIVSDLKNALKNLRLPSMLAWLDLRQSYSRSKIGPFWITIGNVVGILTVTIVYGMIFKVDLAIFLPYIATSMTMWGFLTQSIVESCVAFIGAEGVIKQLPLPFFTYVFRLIWRNLLLLAHNFVVLPIILVVSGFGFGFEFFLLIPGMILVILVLAPLSIILATISARFRDIQPLVANSLQIAFYVTPVIWMPTALAPEIAHYLLGFNPLYHLLQVLRMPILGDVPTVENYAVTVGLAVLTWMVAAILFSKNKARIALWL
jgi:lipopolysaccharide transport system permease protein